MTMTTAQALAVALDHAEETGEYPPELIARVVRMFDAMRIVQLGREGQGDRTARGRSGDGRQLVSVVHHREHRVAEPGVPWERWEKVAERYEAVIHTALTGTHLCERESFDNHREAVDWLSTRLKFFGWTLLEIQ